MSKSEKSGNESADQLISDIRGQDVEKKNNALRKVKKFIKDDKVRKALMEISESDKEHSQFRLNIIKALTSGDKTTNDVVDLLIRLKSSKESLIRRQVVISLTEIGTKKVLSHIIDGLKDESHWVRLFAVRGIKKLTDYKNPSNEAIAALVSAIGDEEEEIRLEAIRSIEWIGNATSKELIKQAKSGNKNLRYGATGILGRFNQEDANAYLIDCLNSGNDRVARIAIRYLGDNKVAKAVPKLLQLAQSTPDFQTSIEISIVKIGVNTAADLLAGFVTYPELKPFLLLVLKKLLPAAELEVVKNLGKVPKEIIPEIQTLIKNA
jgi:HEAT repeat protein